MQTRKIAGDKFANGADLSRKFLVADGKSDGDALRDLLPFFLRESDEVQGKSMANRGEREFLDNADQAAEPGADHSQNLECHVGVGETERLKILLTDVQQSRVPHGSDRGWIVSAIEYRQLSDRTAGPIDSQDLLAAID